MLVLALLVAPLPAVLATGGSLNAAIAAPASGASFTRLDSVSFTDGSTADGCTITSWQWNFGDGSGSTTQHATHTYSALGSKTVALQILSSDCTNLVSTAAVTISIVNIPPVAGLTGPATATAGDALVFDGSGSSDSDGTVSSYRFTIDGVAQAPQASATFGHTFTAAGTHTIELSVVDNDGGVSPGVSVSVDVASAALDSITVAGPDAAAAGSTQEFDPSGFDQYGNDVALAVATFSHTMTTTAGTEDVCYTEGSVTGCKTVNVGAEVLDAITVSGITSIIVGRTGTWTVAGEDQYGNAVALAVASVDQTAPETTGAFDVCYEESGVTGCLSVTAVADTLASIELTGASDVVAGTVNTYGLAGFDQYGNAVPLAQATEDYTAPTLVGPADFCYTEGGVTGCATVNVIPDDLDSITVSGPATLVVDQDGTYAVAGFDQYGNSVALAVTSITYTAGTVTGMFDVCYDESGIQGCQNIEVLPAELESILIGGASDQVAGTTQSYPVTGYDRYSNVVTLAVATVDHVAGTAVGSEEFCYTESDTTGCKTVAIIADALAAITVDGPATQVAGTSESYNVHGADQYGNAVALAVTSVSHAAGTAVGNEDVCYTESSVTGCKTVEITPDALFEITVAGPTVVVAGTTHSYALSGEDQYGNVVTLAQSSLSWTAPRSIGTRSVCYEEDSVSGCLSVDVTYDVLDSILVRGPDTVVVGATVNFVHEGYDQYGNARPLNTVAQVYTAPTVAGPRSVCHTESGITGCKSIQVLPGAPVTITVTGPNDVVAGTTATFSVNGKDSFGNNGATAASSISWTAPPLVGTQDVCHTENGVTGCKTVNVIPAALATITVTGNARVVAGALATFDLAGADGFGNAVTLAQSTLDWTAPRAFGIQSVCYSEAGVTGCKSVEVIPLRIVVTTPVSQINSGRTIALVATALDVDEQPVPATFVWSVNRGSISSTGLYQATAPGGVIATARIGTVTGTATFSVTTQLLMTVAASKASYSQSEAMNGGISIEVTVKYVDGTPVPGATVVLEYRRSLPPMTSQQVGGADGTGKATFSPPGAATIYGSYQLQARASYQGNSGLTGGAYSVTL